MGFDAVPDDVLQELRGELLARMNTASATPTPEVFVRVCPGSPMFACVSCKLDMLHRSAPDDVLVRRNDSITSASEQRDLLLLRTTGLY